MPYKKISKIILLSVAIIIVVAISFFALQMYRGGCVGSGCGWPGGKEIKVLDPLKEQGYSAVGFAEPTSRTTQPYPHSLMKEGKDISLNLLIAINVAPSMSSALNIESGTQLRSKLDLTTEAITSLINQLDKKDQFEIITFMSKVDSLIVSRQATSWSKFLAKFKLRKLSSVFLPRHPDDTHVYYPTLEYARTYFDTKPTSIATNRLLIITDSAILFESFDGKNLYRDGIKKELKQNSDLDIETIFIVISEDIGKDGIIEIQNLPRSYVIHVKSAEELQGALLNMTRETPVNSEVLP